MWESIKKDTLVKTIVVILIGVLAFGFAFNIMFGSVSSSMEDGSMMSSGYSLSTTLETMIELLIKIDIIGLLLGAIVWIFRTITKQTGLGSGKEFTWMKDDPAIRNTLIITGFVLIHIFSFSFLRGMYSNGSIDDTVYAGSTIAYSNIPYSFTALLSLLLKILIIVFVIGLGFGVLMYVKEKSDKSVGSNDNVTNENETTKDCPECKAAVKATWKCCPFCGSDLALEKQHITE